MEDEDKLTPCDHAERHHHTELALSLESQMVFSSSTAQQSNTDTHGETNLLQYKEVRPQLLDLGDSCGLHILNQYYYYIFIMRLAVTDFSKS